MTVKDIISQVESLFGRKPEKYIMRLINDALVDMSSKKRAYKRHKKFNLIGYDRWYELTDDMIDVIRVEIKDTNDRYVMIPKLSNPNRILREDTDESEDSLT